MQGLSLIHIFCVTSIHEDLGTIRREPETVAKEAEAFGTKYVVITLRIAESLFGPVVMDELLVLVDDVVREFASALEFELLAARRP